MKAYVTSIGEPTTNLCIWSLERLGFNVVAIQDLTSLASKLQTIYWAASDDFIRVDADVIVNKNLLELAKYQKDAWWVQPKTFDWYKQDLAYGGVQFIRKEALDTLRKEIRGALREDRPETMMFRCPQFYNPRRCISADLVCGLNGWGQKDIERVKAVKERRGQLGNYDFELAERLNEL